MAFLVLKAIIVDQTTKGVLGPLAFLALTGLFVLLFGIGLKQASDSGRPIFGGLFAQECPACNQRTLHVSSETLSKATEMCPGREKTTRKCWNCGEHSESTSSITYYPPA